MSTLQPMTLGALLDSSGVLANLADAVDAGVLVGRVVSDSRQVVPGDLFVACRGARSHGIAFGSEVVRQGAVAIVSDEPVSSALLAEWNVPLVLVSNARACLGPLASARLGHPSRTLQVIAVTGTNGKTTTTILIAQLLTAAGFRAAAVGTTGIWTAQGIRPSALTTPEATDLQQLFADLLAEGFTHVAIEASSHALDQLRCDGSHFSAAVWTNLSHDHLDYHGTMERYAAAKLRLFTEFGVRADRCFVNADDDWAADPWNKGLAQAFSLGSHPAAEHQVSDLRCDLQGLRGVLRSQGWADLAFRAPLVGRHNAENLAAALLVGRALGVDAATLQQACAVLAAPRGRLEPVPNDRGVLAVVDYAHTPDALQKILTALRPLVAPNRRLWLVFGCGGDRDPAKRPVMGRIAGELADICVVTSDNPRSEQPLAITEAIAAGIRPTRAVQATSVDELTIRRNHAAFLVEVDRARAIAVAAAGVEAGDVLCIAGKGHETTQIIGAVSRPFDDLAVARRALQGEPARADRMEFGGFYFDALLAASATGGRVAQAGTAVTAALCTDTRALAHGALYVALRGERFDGALFIGEAIDKGACGIVCARGTAGPWTAKAAAAGAWLVEVADPQAALGALARAHRGRFSLPVVGVTGSNGKTTTKELTALALSALGDVLATYGNHNNQIGVPQTLAGLGGHHAAAVVEMGMSVPGEIALLAAMAQPRVGIVTSIAEAHLEGLGSVQAIAEEKFALIAALPADGVAILPADEPLLRPLAAGLACRVVWFGRSEGQVRLVGPVRFAGLDRGEPVQHFTASVGGRPVAVALPGLGVHLAHNALAALAAAWVLGVDIAAAAAALQGYRPVGQRMLPARIGPWLVLEDCYNANPRSTETALDTLACLPRPRVAVLGEMRELGPTAPALHQRVGAHAAKTGVDWLVGVGTVATEYAAGAVAAGLAADRAICCADTAVAASWLHAHAPRPATMLVKGSRGARMETALAMLRQLETGTAVAASPGGH